MEISTSKLLAVLKKETKPVKNFTSEQEELKGSTEPISGFENVPTVSVDDDDLIKVQFSGEPRDVPRKSDGKVFAYATVKMLAPHVGFDRKKKEEIELKEGDKAAINLRRHTTLWLQAQANAPLTNKKFTIGIVGTLPSSKGQPAKDYRWRAIAD